MSTEIFKFKESDLKELSIKRFAQPRTHKDKCGYSIRVGQEVIELDAFRMRELVDSLKVFFGSGGYP